MCAGDSLPTRRKLMIGSRKFSMRRICKMKDFICRSWPVYSRSMETEGDFNLRIAFAQSTENINNLKIKGLPSSLKNSLSSLLSLAEIEQTIALLFERQT